MRGTTRKRFVKARPKHYNELWTMALAMSTKELCAVAVQRSASRRDGRVRYVQQCLHYPLVQAHVEEMAPVSLEAARASDA
jgi:hypothetical protein